MLRLLAVGKTNREIARSLLVSLSSVKTYVKRIVDKLRVSDRTQAAVRAVELGLLSDPEGRWGTPPTPSIRPHARPVRGLGAPARTAGRYPSGTTNAVIEENTNALHEPEKKRDWASRDRALLLRRGLLRPQAVLGAAPTVWRSAALQSPRATERAGAVLRRGGLGTSG